MAALDEDEDKVKTYPKLKVHLKETPTLHLYYQENTSLHLQDPDAQVLIDDWKQYHQASHKIIF